MQVHWMLTARRMHQVQLWLGRHLVGGLKPHLQCKRRPPTEISCGRSASSMSCEVDGQNWEPSDSCALADAMSCNRKGGTAMTLGSLNRLKVGGLIPLQCMRWVVIPCTIIRLAQGMLSGS